MSNCFGVSDGHQNEYDVGDHQEEGTYGGEIGPHDRIKRTRPRMGAVKAILVIGVLKREKATIGNRQWVEK